MSNVKTWWGGLGDREKLILSVAAGLLIVMTGGALAYAIASGGAVVASGETMILVGGAVAQARLR